MKVRRLVDVPEERTAPTALLRALREIDPSAEIVYAGDGDWMVGRVQPNAERYRMGAYAAGLELDNPRPNPAALRDAHLQMQGFAVVETFHFQGEPTSEVVHDFRFRSHVYDSGRAAAIRAATETSAGPDEAEHARRAAKVAAAGASDAWRMSHLRPHSVNMGGANPLATT